MAAARQRRQEQKDKQDAEAHAKQGWHNAKIHILDAEAARVTKRSAGLLMAVYAGEHETVEQLLNAGADPNMVDAEGWTQAANVGVSVLLVAVRRGWVTVVALLLEKKANPDHGKPNGTSPLYVAAREGRDEIVQVLLDADADPGNAAASGAIPLNVAMKQLGAESDRLMLRQRQHCVEILQRASHERVEGDAVSMLLLATMIGDTAMMGNTLAMLYLPDHERSRGLPTADLLDETGVTGALNCGSSLLLIATRGNHLRAVQLLLHQKASVDLGKPNGTSPLFVAAQEGYAEVVQVLLSAGADPLKRSGKGTLPLAMARAMKHNEVVVILKNKLIWLRKQKLKLSPEETEKVYANPNSSPSPTLTLIGGICHGSAGIHEVYGA